MKLYLAFLFTFAFILCNGQSINAAPIDPFIYSPLHASNGTQYPDRRQEFGVAFWDNSLYVLGGVRTTDTNDYLTDIWALDTVHSVWNKTSMQLKRAGHCVAQNGTIVYIVGGRGEDSSFRRLNLTSGNWTELPPLPAGHTLHSSCGVAGEVLIVFGGCAPEFCGTKLSIYNVSDSKWVTVIDDGKVLPSSAFGPSTMNILKDGGNYTAVIMGGFSANLTEFNAYKFFLFDHKWTGVHVVGLPHLASSTAVVTSVGNILLFGGEDLTSGDLSKDTYLISLNGTDGNSTLLNFQESPSARKYHASVYTLNRMITYGGDYVDGESSASAWQLVNEAECLRFHTCGECLLAQCFWCNPKAEKPVESTCVAGNLNPYIAETCTEGGYNHTDLLKCRRQHEAAAWLVAVTIVVLVVIAILVVATYVVDYKKGKASSGGYEPIGGI